MTTKLDFSMVSGDDKGSKTATSTSSDNEDKAVQLDGDGFIPKPFVDSTTVGDEDTFTTPVVLLDSTDISIAWVAATATVTISNSGLIGDKATCVDGIDTTGVNGSTINEGVNFTNLTVAAGCQAGTTTILLDEDSTTGAEDAGANQICIGVSGVADDGALQALMILAINGTADARITYATSGNGQTGVTGITAAGGGTGRKITLTMDQRGTAGNIGTVLTEIAGGADMVAVTGFTGGQDIASHNVSIPTAYYSGYASVAFVATANATVTTGDLAEGVNAGTWAVDHDSNDNTAENLKNCINGHTKFTATRGTGGTSNVVTITQATAGTTGNTTVTLTDPGVAGISKTNFTGGINGSSGFYTRIGDRAFITMTCRANRGTNTGDLTVTGLPFTSDEDVNNYSTFSYTPGTAAGLDNTPDFIGAVDPNSSVMSFRWGPNNATTGTPVSLSDTYIKASTDIMFHVSGHYKVSTLPS